MTIRRLLVFQKCTCAYREHFLVVMLHIKCSYGQDILIYGSQPPCP
nr:hypothetical protein Iba_chr05fCG16420 [Ipomoea batatas]